MTVISAKQMREGDTGSSDNKRRWTYNVDYLVQTDNKNDSIALIILQANGQGLPVRGSFYPGDPFSQLARYTVRRGDKETWFVVTAIYEVPPLNEDRQDRFTHPLARPPRYRIEEENVTLVAEKDRFGDAILNTAGFPYDTALEVDETRIVLVAEKNVKTLDEIIERNVEFVNKTNSDVYRGQPARTWLVRSIGSSELKSEENITYFTESYRIVFKPDLWNHVVLNRGFKGALVNGGPTVQFMQRTEREEEEQIPVSEPVLLSILGVKTTSPFFSDFEVIEQTSFADIGV